MSFQFNKPIKIDPTALLLFLQRTFFMSQNNALTLTKIFAIAAWLPNITGTRRRSNHSNGYIEESEITYNEQQQQIA